MNKPVALGNHVLHEHDGQLNATNGGVVEKNKNFGYDQRMKRPLLPCESERHIIETVSMKFETLCLFTEEKKKCKKKLDQLIRMEEVGGENISSPRRDDQTSEKNFNKCSHLR